MSHVPEEVSSANQGLFLVQLGRARKHLREGRLDQARQELEAAQIVRPNDEDVLNLVSVIEFKLGRYEDAAKAARKLVSENPSSAVLHANLGLILFKAGALPEAEQELRRAIELKPDHARSHLYLGLLYRTRGRLGLALEHLRFAGAKRLVSEIEDILKKSMRQDPDQAPAVDRTTASSSDRPTVETPASFEAPAGGEDANTAEISFADTVAPEPPAPSLRLVREPAPEQAEVIPFTAEADEPTHPTPGARKAATEVTPPPPAHREAEPRADVEPVPVSAPAADRAETKPPSPVSTDKVPVVTSPGEGRERLRRNEDGDPRVTAAAAPSGTRPLFQVRADGGLEVASSGAVFVRKGSVVWYSGKVRFANEPAFEGTRFDRILRAEGRGNFFLSDPGKSAYSRDLGGLPLFVEAGRLLALDTALNFRLDPIHDFHHDRRVDILKVTGHGSVILSVSASLLGHDVSHEFPLIVNARDLVAWSGKLVPSVVEDRFLEEVMVPDAHGTPKIRFEGQGLVLTEPPRARRRASDLGRTTEADRRS
jgi:Tfp pilus assembly protein PilF/uncharacterized protein (AIM24 family)